jgi:hypothetical protein
MKDIFAEDFILSTLRKINEQTSLSPSNTKKYDVYFKRYAQICMKEIVRLYSNMKEFRVVKESFQHIKKKIEHVSCSRSKGGRPEKKTIHSI